MKKLTKKKPTKKKLTLKSYHFSIGNSTTGPVGFCARVMACSKKDAVALLKEELPQEAPIAEEPCTPAEWAVEYMRVYFNPSAITEKHIDEINPA